VGDLSTLFGGTMVSVDVTEMPLKMETIVPPKRRDNSPTPGGDILEDVVELFEG
jgi:hypothetical protein